MADFPQQYAAGTTAPGNLTLGIRKDSAADLAGTDAYTASVQLDSAGSLRVSEEGGKTTYAAATSGLVAASSCTDLIAVGGSATKVVRIQEVRISGTATAAKTIDVLGILRSTANSSGTSTTLTAGKYHSGDAAATATVKAYTANPTVGTAAGTIKSDRYTVGAADTALPPVLVWDFRGRAGGRGLRLNGTAEGFSVNLNTLSPGAGNSFNVAVVWTEEATTA